MEKRDTVDGETLKREYCTACLGGGALGAERGGGESDSAEDVGRGNRGKSSSHSYPAPEAGKDIHKKTCMYVYGAKWLKKKSHLLVEFY